MSVFTNDLVTRWVPATGRWVLTETFEFHSGEYRSGLFVRCEAGMESDLASIPRAVRWLVPKVGKDAQASVVHDRVYRDGFMLMRVAGHEKPVAVSRGMADSMYYQAMLALGVGRLRREAIYRGLQVGGWVAWNRYRRKGLGISTETTR